MPRMRLRKTRAQSILGPASHSIPDNHLSVVIGASKARKLPNGQNSSIFEVTIEWYVDAQRKTSSIHNLA